MRNIRHRHRRWWVLRAFGRNPLLRRADRVEAGVIVLGIGAAIAATALCVIATVGIYHSHAQLYAAQMRANHATTASVIESVPLARSRKASVLAKWVIAVDDPGGHHRQLVHSGWVSTDAAVKSGDTVRIWLNDASELVPTPRPVSQAVYDAAGMGAGIWVVAMLGVVALVGLVRATLSRYRLCNLDREFSALAGGTRSKRSR